MLKNTNFLILFLIFHFGKTMGNENLFPTNREEKREKYLVSRRLEREMEIFYPFPAEKFGKKSISLPVSRGKRDSRPSLC